jgi:hypothetical protein
MRLRLRWFGNGSSEDTREPVTEEMLRRYFDYERQTYMAELGGQNLRINYLSIPERYEEDDLSHVLANCVEHDASVAAHMLVSRGSAFDGRVILKRI